LQARSEQEARVGLKDADAVLLYHDVSISNETVTLMDRCKAIVRCGVGYDNVDIRAAGDKGIVVCNVPDYGTEDVADHALMMLLGAARRLGVLHETIRRGGWQPEGMFGAPRLRGKTVGIIGCGRIGTAMALRCKALGMRVVYFDPYLRHAEEKMLGLERVESLEELLPQCMAVSLHCLLTPETKHILNDKSLALMPKDSVVVNTARGGCVDTQALVRALESGHLAGAGIDVVEREPLDVEALRKHPRVLLSPHSAYYSVEGYWEMRSKGAEEARRALTGKPLWNPVNRSFLKGNHLPLRKEQWAP
ncbi:MAG: C-terminal binding protein, partial [Gemmataceae bacterium]